MELQIRPVEFAGVQAAVTEHVLALTPPVDSFLEDHIVQSNHYQLQIDGAVAGFASIHNSSLITQFHLDPPYRRYGQLAFQQVRRLEQVQAAFVPTCDEFLLAHALDDYRTLEKQAYFFQLAPGDRPRPAVAAPAYRQAELSDTALIAQHSGTFFDPIERSVQAGEIFIGFREGACVGFGIRARSTFYPAVASIGMFTVAEARQGGVGTATISFLIAQCQRDGLRPVAGCWYYNHNSKKTLERAGMFSQTRLLKVGY